MGTGGQQQTGGTNMVCEAMPCHKHDAQFTVFHPRWQIFGLQQSFNRSNFLAFLETWRAPALALQLTQRALYSTQVPPPYRLLPAGGLGPPISIQLLVLHL